MKKWFQARVVGLPLCWSRLLGFNVVKSTRSVTWVPSQFVQDKGNSPLRSPEHLAKLPKYPDPLSTSVTLANTYFGTRSCLDCAWNSSSGIFCSGTAREPSGSTRPSRIRSGNAKVTLPRAIASTVIVASRWSGRCRVQLFQATSPGYWSRIVERTGILALIARRSLNRLGKSARAFTNRSCCLRWRGIARAPLSWRRSGRRCGYVERALGPARPRESRKRSL